MKNPNANEFLNEEKDSVFIKCEGCGSNMTFDPQTQTLKCDYCGAFQDFKKDANVKELEIEHAFEQAAKWDEVRFYSCENCGAKFSLRADEVAVTCPYCSTSHVAKTEDLTGIKPNAVYPFLLDKSQAVVESKKWAKKRIFAPSKFKKNLIESNIRGIYFPCFTFDSETHSVYKGRLGDRRTRTVKRNGKTHTETYIVWKTVSGTFNRSFDDVMVTAGDLAQDDMNKIAPFKRETICVYEKKFLSGYTASHYSKDIKYCWCDAKTAMDAQIRRDILARENCDVVDYLNVSTTHDKVTYKYVLVPTYCLQYKYKGKNFPVVINGNTGKTTGKTPISPIRVAIAALLGIALIIGLMYLYVLN